MCVCACVYVHVCACVHACVYVHVCACVHVCMCMCVHVCACMCLCACVYVHVCACVHACVHVCMQVHHIADLQYVLLPQAKVLDRDGYEQLECPKGWQYIADMGKTEVGGKEGGRMWE